SHTRAERKNNRNAQLGLSIPTTSEEMQVSQHTVTYNEGIALPSVEAIIPSFNWGDRLKLCLEKLVVQKYRGKFTITVVDGGSEDDTVNIAKEFGCNLLTKKGAPPDGLCGLKNFGIANSNADLIWIVDIDNLMFSSSVLEELVRPFVEESSIDMAIPIQITNPEYEPFTNYLTYKEMLPIKQMISESVDRGAWYLVDDVWYGINNSSLVRREAIKEVGGWDRDIRVLRRMRELGISRGAIVKNAFYYHDQRVGPLTFVKKIRRRIIFFGKISNVTSEYFVEEKNKSINTGLHSLFSSSVLSSLRNYKETKDTVWLYGLLFPLLVFLAALSAPFSTIKVLVNGTFL
ncbi:MAG: glycosyltransferase, partial [Nitrososphaerota archaeon]